MRVKSPSELINNSVIRTYLLQNSTMQVRGDTLKSRISTFKIYGFANLEHPQSPTVYQLQNKKYENGSNE